MNLRNIGFISIFILAVPAFADSRKMLDQIENSIKNETGLGTYTVNMEYSRGDIVLKGEVSSQAVKERIGKIAASVDKNGEIKNFLRINPSLESGDKIAVPVKKPADRLIEENIYSELRKIPDIDISGISVTVKEGIATLAGEGGDFRSVDKILSTALMVDGVSDVESQMTVRGGSYPKR